MARIVCQVLHRPNRITFTWSEGAASFEPYHLEGQEVIALNEAARAARRQLAQLVHGADRHAAVQLAEIGHQLYQEIFRHNQNDPHASEIEHWLSDLRDRNEVVSLDMLGDIPGAIPWNVVYDQSPPAQTLLAGDPAALRPFWGLRYVLAAGKRVNPLRVACVLDSPNILLAADPELLGTLPDSEKNRLGAWAVSHGLDVLDSVTALRGKLLTQAPDILYLFGNMRQASLWLGGENIALPQLREYLAAAKEGNPDPIVFLQACGDAGQCDAWECFVAQAVNTLSGIVMPEVPIPAVLANKLGVEALAHFLDNQGIGQALHSTRAGHDLEALPYSAFCPTHVKLPGDENTEPDVAGPEPLPLPEAPYHPLFPFDSEDRGLFTGREDDTIRCAGLLDEAATRGLLLHGGGGVGKTSFLRAGLVPHLETEAVGFIALRDRTPDEETTKEQDYPVVALRPGTDLTGQIAEALSAFCAQPFGYTTPLGTSVSVDLPGTLRDCLTEPAEDTATSLWSALRDDPALLANLLDELTRRLPCDLLIVIEQAEDLVLQTSKAGRRRRQQALTMLSEVLRSAARCKIILSTRTEFMGRLLNQMPESPVRWRDYYLGELTEEQILAVVTLPTVAEPVPYSSEIPRQKYQFFFEEGLPQRIVKEALKAAQEKQRSALALLQVLCADLYERMRKRNDTLITKADRKGARPADDIVVSYLNNKIRDLPVAPGDRPALRNVMEQLYERHADGTVTRDLVPAREAADKWKSSTPFDTVMEAAGQEGLVEVNQMLVEGRPGLYLSLPQEALARAAAQWDDDRKRQAFGRTRIIDTLWIMIPMLFLVSAITWTLTRRSAATAAAEEKASPREEQLVKAFQSQLEANRWPIYVGDLARAEQAWSNGNALLSRQLLLKQQPLRTADLRDFEWYYLWNKVQGRGPEATGHKGPITRVAVAPDGHTGASASQDSTIKLWNLVTGQVNAVLEGHAGPVFAVAFSPDGKTLASGGADKIIRIWDANAGKDTFAKVTKEQKALTGHTGAVRVLAFSPAGLVSAGADKQVITWDVAAGKQVNVFKDHTGAVESLAISPDGKTIASASADQTIFIHDGVKTLHTIKAPGIVTALAFAPNGQTLSCGATEQQGGRDAGLIRFWDAGTGKEVGGHLQHASGVFALAYVPQTKLLASAGKDNLVRLWDPATTRQVTAYKGHLGWIVSLDAARADATIVSGSLDGTLKIWGSSPPDVIAAHPGAAEAVIFAFDDKVLITGGHDGTVSFWETATGKQLAKLTGLGGVTSLAFTNLHNPPRLAAGTWNDKHVEEVRLWDITWDTKDGLKTKELPDLKGHTKGVTCVAFTADGRTLASGSADETAIVWDTESKKQRYALKGHEGGVRCLAFPEADLPDVLLTGSADGKIRQWDVGSGKEYRAPLQAHAGPVSAVQYFFGVVGFITAGDDHSTKFWVWNPGKEAVLRNTHRSNAEPITAMVQSPNRRFLAVGSGDHTVKLFNTQIEDRALGTFFAQERFTFTGLHAPIRALAISRNSRILAAADADGTVHLWRAAVPVALKAE